MTFDYFDLIIGALIIFLGLKGIIDGFIKEFFGLAGIIGGIYYGSRYAESVGNWISDNLYHIKNEAALTFVGFLAALFAIWIGMVILGNLITKLTHASGMGFFNKLLGLLFGWAKIFLIFSVIIYAISSIEITKKVLEKYTKNSILYPLLVQTGSYIIKLKPEDFVSPNVQKQGKEFTKKVSNDVQESAVETAKKSAIKAIEQNISKEKH
ncbi:CvpA family protein [Nitratiruptor tergarcus]|uniref:Membrane protein required for colicin V production n=1 Tax=Nitratiruptor tergarcus DSM 16512 TaxID=1069081 RepID=A0A1W1WUF1_9BACT|nr:CvpA family protein [Nitratiruptor tergarcus]SMC09363.1 membrane protein required for colicin V production [Nitratiruptor tergarcus DSM 16512]